MPLWPGLESRPPCCPKLLKSRHRRSCWWGSRRLVGARLLSCRRSWAFSCPLAQRDTFRKRQRERERERGREREDRCLSRNTLPIRLQLFGEAPPVRAFLGVSCTLPKLKALPTNDRRIDRRYRRIYTLGQLVQRSGSGAAERTAESGCRNG